MVWFKVDDSLAFHAKALMAGNSAMGLWVRAGAWSSAHLTDGFIPGHVALAIGTSAEVEHLVMAGLWTLDEGGYRFHEWTDRNPTADTVKARRDATTARQQRWREHAQQKALEASNVDALRDRLETPTRPDPSPPSKEGVAARKRATRIPDPFLVTGDMRTWAEGEVPGLDVNRSTRQFVDHWRAASGRNATKMDWVAAWRKWMRTDWIEHPPVQAQSLRDRYAGVRRLDD